MNIKVIFVIISSLVGISCFIPYIIDILKRKTKPHVYSWIIWTVLQLIGVMAMIDGGAGLGVMSLLIGAILCGFIFILSLFYGTHNIKIFDTICLIGAIISIIFYFFIHNTLLSIIIVTVTDLVGFMPTFRKSYEEPKTETISTYVLSSISSLFALFALSNITFTTSLYLISLIVSNGLCALIIFLRRKDYFNYIEI